MPCCEKTASRHPVGPPPAYDKRGQLWREGRTHRPRFPTPPRPPRGVLHPLTVPGLLHPSTGGPRPRRRGRPNHKGGLVTMNRWPLFLACLTLGGLTGTVVTDRMIHGQATQPPAATREPTSYRDVVKKVLPAVVSIEARV